MPSVASSATPSRTQTAAFSVLWRSSFSSGCDALQAQHEAEQNLAVGHNGQLSLVQLLVGDSQLVTLMNWRSIEPLSGQCVQIDKWGGVIYSPPSLRPFQNFTALPLRLVHPAVGVQHARVKRPFRPDVPGPILRLKLMWEAAIEGGYSSLSVTLVRTCQCCSVVDGSVGVCALCLVASHSSCAAECARKLGKRLVLSAHLPDIFQAPGTLCPMCSRCYVGGKD